MNTAVDTVAAKLETERQIPEEDIPLVLNAAFAERFAGMIRERSEDGKKWLWHFAAVPGQDVDIPPPQPVDIDHVAPVRGVGYSLIKWLDEHCNHLTAEMQLKAGQRVAWNIIQGPSSKDDQVPIHFVVIQVLDCAKKGAIAPPLADVHAHDLGIGIALAMLASVKANLAVLHRELFPHRYLLLNS